MPATSSIDSSATAWPIPPSSSSSPITASVTSGASNSSTTRGSGSRSWCASPIGGSAGTVRSDLVSLLDVAATSLDLAGIPIPDYVQGRALFAAGFEPRRRVYSARDRCDETLDLIRSVRTERYKYIRNFMSYVSHAQPNRYKDGKEIMKRMRALHRKGKLDELQARIFASSRPTEELYDLKADPFETLNLADDPDHQKILGELRADLSSG